MSPKLRAHPATHACAWVALVWGLLLTGAAPQSAGPPVPVATGAPAVVRAAAPAAPHAASTSPTNRAPISWTITAAPGEHGLLSPAGPEPVPAGATRVFDIQPFEGHHVTRVLVDGRAVGAPAAYTFDHVRANHTIAAEFAVNTYRITAVPGANGGFLPARPPAVPHGGSLRIAVVPRPGYHLDSLYVDGEPVRASDQILLRNITGPRRIAATFAVNYYTLTASAGLHAHVSPSGPVTVKHGGSQTYTFAADPGYAVTELLIDDKPVRAGGTYTLFNVRDHHRLVARTTRHVATVLAPAGGENWVGGQTVSIHWLPIDAGMKDSADVQISFHGADGPWNRIWRGLLREGSMEWTVPKLDCDSLMVSVVKVGHGFTQGADFANGLVRLHSMEPEVGFGRFSLRAVPSPAPVGSVKFALEIPITGHATVEIFSVSGRLIWRQQLGRLEAGERSVAWNGRLSSGGQVDPGVYFARLTTDRGKRNCRLVLVP